MNNWMPKKDEPVFFGIDREMNPPPPLGQFFNRVLPERSKKEKLADAWAAFRDAYKYGR